MVLEKTPESPSDRKEIKPVNLKGDQPWLLIGRADAEVQIPVFSSSDVNSWLTEKVPNAGKSLRADGEKGVRGWDGWMVLLMH